MELLDIIEHIEKTAPLHLAAGWDNSGVQVASFRKKVTHVGVTLDPSVRSVGQALEAGADFLLTHHPLTMKPRFPDVADSYLEVLSMLLKRDVCLYSAHTTLDANPRGPVRWLAQRLGLVRVTVLEPEGRLTRSKGEETEEEFGFGFVGDLPKSLPYREFCACLARAIGKAEWQTMGPEVEMVSRVACCPGSGGSLFAFASQAGADLYITGDIKYHAALEASVRTLDVGHFCIEEEMMRSFAETLGRELAVPVTFFPAIDPIAIERV